MLNVMRDNLKHLKWVLVVVALAMLGYLGSYFDPRVRNGSLSSDWAAKVTGRRSRRKSSYRSPGPRTITTASSSASSTSR